MVKLFMQGEPFFMWSLTSTLIVLLFLKTYSIHGLSFGINRIATDEYRSRLLKEVGLFSLFFGVFTQFLGLYGALKVIEVWGEVSAEMLFQGIRVSFIPMGYGLMIFALSRILSRKSFVDTQSLS